jgi:hypothetical protein
VSERLDRTTLTIVTATRLEARAVCRELGAITIVRAGIGLSRAPDLRFDGAAISCGLAGGTRPDLPTGTVLVPTEVAGPDGKRRPCDPSLVAALCDGARRLGLTAVTAPLRTSRTIVRGEERQRCAALGFAGVDMETAFIDAARLAAVRVILDTPQHELSEAWLSPLRALLTPSAWGELPWLAREGPRCARIAARVLAGALQT